MSRLFFVVAYLPNFLFNFESQQFELESITLVSCKSFLCKELDQAKQSRDQLHGICLLSNDHIWKDQFTDKMKVASYPHISFGLSHPDGPSFGPILSFLIFEATDGWRHKLGEGSRWNDFGWLPSYCFLCPNDSTHPIILQGVFSGV